MSATRPTAIKYKPHIDGLRAVAVLLVILHHLGDWAGTSGGYVGVDVFFVISGYLITSIVKREIEAGSFSFGGFYKRRVVRLAPAYFTVLIATTGAALIWMLPAELLAYAKSVVASSMFLANFHMWKEVGGYFGSNADTVPLLHLWTLGVEEQFYIFWPIVLIVGHRLVSARTMLWLVVCGVVVSAVLSQWGVERYPAAAYYLLPTRVFELAVGAVLAYLPLTKLARRSATAVSIAGLALISYAALAYGKETLFPGYAALIPVLGTAMVLRWGESTVVGTALSLPIATSIGKISYPAYLWHWPIIAFLHINDVAITIPIGVSVVAATLTLSWLTFRWVELPSRRLLTLPPTRVVFTGAGAPIAASVAVAVVIISLHGFPMRFSDSLNRKSEALHAFPSKLRGLCNEGPPIAALPADDCILGRPGGNVDFLLVGDSHANHFTGFLDVLGKDAGLRGYDMTRSNTPFMPGVELAINEEPEYNRNFAPRNQYVSKLLQRETYDVVVLAGNYAEFYNRDILRIAEAKGRVAFERGMRAAIRESSAAAELVVVFSSIPQLDSRLFDCTLRAERFRRDLDCELPASKNDLQSGPVGSFFDKLKVEFPEVVWVESDKLMCDEVRCLTEIDGVPLYKDDGHLNDLGSRLLATKWLAQFGNPLKPTPLRDVAASRPDTR